MSDASGTGEGGGRVVYLLHGLLATAGYHFGPLVEAWKDEMEVVPMDLPGHGACPVDAGADYIASSVAYARGVMDRFGPGDVIAASFVGGPVAVRCALEAPGLVRSLVLTGFVPDVPRESFLAWLEGFQRLADENGDLVRWYEERHGERWSDTLDTYHAEARERYEESVRVTGEMLAALRPPTLVGNGSKKSNEREAAANASKWGRSVRGAVIEDAGHIPSRDNPERFKEIVECFWEEVSVGGVAPSEG